MIKKIKASLSEKIIFIFVLLLGLFFFSSFFFIKDKCLFVKDYDPLKIAFDNPKNIAVLNVTCGEFVGIYPQGHLDSWNLGTEPSKADDVAFINSIIKELENYNNLNMNKIYAIGTSNGSGMVNKLGIHTSHFKAIAPVVSQLMESMPIKDNTKPISIFQINGAKDSTIPIDGGIAFGHNFLDALKSAELWAINFECALPPQKKIMNDKTIYTFIGCNDNKEIKYIRVENGGHNLRPTYPNMFSDIWNFFKRF